MFLTNLTSSQGYNFLFDIIYRPTRYGRYTHAKIYSPFHTHKTFVLYCMRLYMGKILYIDFKFDGLYISLVIAVLYICGQLHTMTHLLYARRTRSVFVVQWMKRNNTFHPISPLQIDTETVRNAWNSNVFIFFWLVFHLSKSFAQL